MSEATLRPWKIKVEGEHVFHGGEDIFELVSAVESAEYVEPIGGNEPYYPPPMSRADAELIVRIFAAHDDLVAALEAVFPLVTERCAHFTHTHYQNGEITEKSRNEKRDRQAMFDKVAAALAKGKVK